MKLMMVFVGSCLLAGPVAWAAPVQPTWQWLFDEETTSTTALDTGAAGAQKNGTILDVSADTDRRSTLTPFSYAGNKSFVAGSKRIIDVPLAASVGTQTTISVWARLDNSYDVLGNSWVFHTTPSSGHRVVWYYGASGAAVGSDPVYWNGKYRGDDNATHGGAITALSNEAWRHLVLVRDGTEVDIWQGDLGGSLTKVWTLVLPAGDNTATTVTKLFVGGHEAKGNIFKGQLDEFAIWDSALSDSDLAWLHSNSLSAIPEPAGLALLGLAVPALLRRRQR